LFPCRPEPKSGGTYLLKGRVIKSGKENREKYHFGDLIFPLFSPCIVKGNNKKGAPSASKITPFT
jgi:hypothetical protein